MIESARKLPLLDRNVTWINLAKIISSFLSLSSSQEHRRTRVAKDFREDMGVGCEVRPGNSIGIVDSSGSSSD